MAIDDPSSRAQALHRFPQNGYVDAVRWLPPLSALRRRAAVALFDPDSATSSLQIHSLSATTSSKTLTPQHSSLISFPCRIDSLRTTVSIHNKPLLALTTSAGSVHVLRLDADADDESGSIESEVSFPVGVLFGGGGMDLMEVGGGGVECVTAGEDGRVNVVRFGSQEPELRCVYDGCGLTSYSAVKWASTAEFATGGLGFGLQWWDLRRPGGAVSQFKGGWSQTKTSGIVHSIDIHPSRKHSCLAGGSLGTVFAWDIRWPQKPIVLSGVGAGDTGAHSLSESEVWEVQFDHRAKTTNMPSSKILPAMICSEDGILAVVEQGEEPIELLTEPCAINSFDIDRNNPSDVICSLEWESIAILTRP